MSFGGGGGAGLPAHEHTNAPLDGGPLDFNNTTIGSMAAGDITYSDGNALQILNAPGVPNNEVLTFQALATAPSWQTVTAPVSVGSDTASLGSNFTTSAATPASVTNLDVDLNTVVGGRAIIASVLECNSSGLGGIQSELEDDGSYLAGSGRAAEVTNTSQYWNMSMNQTMSADGSNIQCMVWDGGNTVLVRGGTGSQSPTSTICCLGVG